jgi:hypothetical protein
MLLRHIQDWPLAVVEIDRAIALQNVSSGSSIRIAFATGNFLTSSELEHSDRLTCGFTAYPSLFTNERFRRDLMDPKVASSLRRR